MRGLQLIRFSLAILVATCFLVTGRSGWAQSETTKSREEDVALQNASELDAFLRLNRADLLPILPPAADFILRQPASPEIVPFAWMNFPPELLKQLADRLEYEYSAPVYPLRIVEDAQTRAQHLFDSRGQWLFSLDAPSFGYDPFAPLKAAFPQLYSGASTDGLRAYESLFDPSRIELQIKLLPSEYLDQYLYVRERLAMEQSLAKEPEDFGLRMLLDLEDHLYFTGIRTLTNGIALDLTWPEGFTNRLDIYRATDLMDRDWRRVASLLETDGLDSLSWTNTASHPPMNFYAAGNADLDSDQDGLSDAFEIFVLKTDPDDPDSFGVRISGTASYAGNESGPVIVSAELQSNAWTRTWCEDLSGPGSYTNWVANQTGYWVKAYMDVNTNRTRDVWEPWGVHANFVMAGTQDVTGVDIILQDQPSIWGTIAYTGSATGDVHVLAVTGDEWVSEYRTVIPWIQSYSSTTGDPVYLTFPASYSITGLPPGEYRIRAFMDENGDGQRTALEPDGQYAPTLISFTNRVTGLDFTLGLDSNTNGIPDWWGLQHFGGATNAVAAADPDGDGQTNLQEYLDGTDPNDSNSFRATASGSIVYTGGQGGPVYVDVYDWQTNLLQRIECEGDAPWFFETASLPGYSTMALTAFRDSNTNGVADLETEAHARFLIPGMIPTEGIHLILKDPDSSGDGYPNWSSSDPGAFIDNNGNGIGDGFEPNPDIPGYWVSAYTEIALPTTVGPHLLDPGLPTNAVLTGLAFVGSGYSSFTVEGIISYDLPGYFFYEMQYRQLTNSLTDRRTGILSMYVENAELGDNCYASFKNPAPLILPPECNTATAVYSVHNFGITGITPISGISNHVGSIWLQDMVKFCEAKTGTNTSETVAVTMGHGDDLSLTNLLSTVLGLPTLTWQVNGDGGSIMATPPLPGAPYGKILVGVNNHTNSINSAPNWEEQGIQPVVELDTSWLRVGHVDEAIMFISTNQYLVASPWLAADLLHAEIAAGNETNTMWFGVGPVSMRTYTISFVVIDDNSGSPKITALSTGLPDSVNPMDIVFTNHLFTTGDVLRVNDEILRVTSVNGSTVTVSRAQGGRPAQAHDEGARIYALSDMMKLNLPVLDHPENSVAKRIETLTNTLHADVGSAITPIPMPVLFEWVDNYLGKGFVAGTPNIVNCLVMSPTRIIMAEPGIACFKNYAISQVPQTTDHFDDFWSVHIRGGNIHCATAAVRELTIEEP